VREPPPEVVDAEVLDLVRREWDADADRVEHLPLGFGAHHWSAFADGTPRWFVTYDRGGPRVMADLEASYAGARALREGGLEFVLAPVSARTGPMTVPCADGALSCSPWRDGTAEGPLDVRWTATALGRLHAAPPPSGIPRWGPKVGEDFADETTRLTGDVWGPGPHADAARAAVRRHLDDLRRWTERYHRLADVARGRAWVVAHGEPHDANQLLTAGGRFLVDWDTLRLAPPELDLRVLVDAGMAEEDAGADPEMLELFDLEWRLDEISQYAAWFAAPHAGTADDDIAFGGLLHELTRP
jgi:spectinomycin phosphotransferase